MAVVLVTGANGFIGSHVCERFLAEGHRVRALVRETSDLAFLAGLDVDRVTGDVTDAASLAPAVLGAEVVVHVAGLASDWGPLSRFLAVNLEGTKNVATAAAAAGVRRLVHVSSASVHGFAGFRDRAEDGPCPQSPFPYVESKRRAEEWLRGSLPAPSPEVVVLRPGNVYGPRDHTFIEKYADALLRGRLGYVGGGRCLTCPVYVENLRDAILAAAFHPAAKGEAFLVTDGLVIDWRTFTERLCAHLGVRPPRLSVPSWLGYSAAATMEGLWAVARAENPPLLTRYRIRNGGRDYHFSIEKAKRLLGWTPAVDLEQALERTAAWLRTRPGVPFRPPSPPGG